MRAYVGVASIAAVALLAAGCSQDDQDLPFSLVDHQPVTRTVPASGEMRITSPEGLSVTFPEGSLPPGSQVTVTPVDPREISGVPELAGEVAFLLSFDAPLSKAPTVTYSSAFREPVTATRLLRTVPVLIRVDGTDAAPASRMNLLPPISTGDDEWDNELGSLAEAIAFLNYIMKIGIDGFLGLLGFDYRQFVNLLEDCLAKGEELFDVLPECVDTQLFEDATAQFEAKKAQADACNGPHCPPMNDLLVGLINTRFSTLGSPVDLDALRGADSHPLIPPGQSSATFVLMCTGVTWGEGILRCGEENVDARASQVLLDRYAGSIMAINHIIALATLNADGTARGEIQYDAALRVPMASGISGYPVADTLDLTGNWSVEGNRITVAGYTFAFSVPDEKTLILTVDDSVKVKHNGGGESWEHVQAHLKLSRMTHH